MDDIQKLLSNPGTYPESGPVDLRETHISQVFLTSDFAYKRLKPVRFPFLDFSSREARYFECWNEVRLNRRLARSVYLDVLPITSTNGVLQLGGNGHPLDWIMKMIRLAEETTLENHIQRGDASTRDIDRSLAVLIPFFQKAHRGPEINDGGKLEIIRRNQIENHEAIEQFFAQDNAESESIQRLRSAQLQFLTMSESLFEQRVQQGWIRDGHGDLRAEHIYLMTPPVIVDCIAFNNRFRHADVLDEFCFLATDLERLGRPDLADYLISQYREQMGDPAPDSLVSFYKSYRSAVRAKVACLRAAEQTGSDQTNSTKEAVSHLQSAINVMEKVHEPFLIMVCGLSGSGKSYLAAHLSELFGAAHFRSDKIRKELFGTSPVDHSAPVEMYTEEASEQTYRALLDRAKRSLENRVTTVVDATFRRQTVREKFWSMAREISVEFLCVEVTCPDEVAVARIRERTRRGTDPSDADFSVRLSQKEEFDPVDEVLDSRHLSVNGTFSPEENCRLIVSRLRVV
ncbi:MAG: bifunctional aminoglycoside phosphotransferase/ATP-binding protein [Planctomycetaceae bacterium]